MNKNDIQNLIADFYRVCLFGTKDPDIEDAAKRAYRDLCRTLKLNKGENGISHRDNVISEIIELRIKEKLMNSVCMSQGDYDEFHHALCEEIIGYYSNEKSYVSDFYYGQAQKWINMTMKYLCVIGEERYPWLNRLYPFLHIPIDSVILGKIIGDFEIESVAVKGKRVLLKNLSWSRIDKDTYDAIQNVLREKIGENEIPIVWEFKAWNNPKENE